MRLKGTEHRSRESRGELPTRDGAQLPRLGWCPPERHPVWSGPQAPCRERVWVGAWSSSRLQVGRGLQVGGGGQRASAVGGGHPQCGVRCSVLLPPFWACLLRRGSARPGAARWVCSGLLGRAPEARLHSSPSPRAYLCAPRDALAHTSHTHMHTRSCRRARDMVFLPPASICLTGAGDGSSCSREAADAAHRLDREQVLQHCWL